MILLSLGTTRACDINVEFLVVLIPSGCDDLAFAAGLKLEVSCKTVKGLFRLLFCQNGYPSLKEHCKNLLKHLQ